MRTRVLVAGLLAAVVGACVLADCKTTTAGPSAAPGVTVASLTVTSNAFASNGQIPVDYSCDGADKSPGITWSSPPDGTKSLVVILDDPDAPSGTFTHWIVFNLSPDTRTLAEAVDPSTIGARLGANDFHSVTYNGPCPPKRELHRYYVRVYALDAQLSAREGSTRDEVGAAMNQHVLGEGALVGTFSH
jgi:Raf kinase inhibitor-like YbhB/YbcL family protein